MSTFPGHFAPLEIKSAEQEVYVALRDQIVRGLPPLAPLRLAELAETFKVSTMPVRAALRRLEAEGLVVSASRRGSRVAPLSLADIEQIQTIRCRVEGLAARLGAPRVEDADLARMRLHLAALRTSVTDGDVDSYVSSLRCFEAACYQRSEWPRLLHLVEELRLAAERYLRIAIRNAMPGFLPDFWERFYAAAENRDGDAAEAALREALMWTLEQIRVNLRK